MSDTAIMILRLMAVMALVLANAFFVASEFALVSVRRSRMETLAKDGEGAARTVLKALSDLDQYIAGTQLGITLASLMLGWIGEAAFAHMFENALVELPGLTAVASAHALAVAVSFTLITFLHVVLGELVPKSLALQHPDETAMWVARPMRLTVWLMRPGIVALNGTGNLVLRLLGLPAASGHTSVHSVDELKILMDHSHKEGVIHTSEREMLQRVFNFKDLIVRQVMVHRLEMRALSATSSLVDARAYLREHPHSRYPVYAGDLDHIVGVFHTKDLLTATDSELDAPVSSLARPPLWVPETLPLDELLVQFRRARDQVAMVLDEYGGTCGMVTLEDVTAELMGELDSEEAPGEAHHSFDDAGDLVADGRTRLDELSEDLGVNLDDDDVDTLGGLVAKHLGRVPDPGDHVVVQRIRFTVLAMDGRRVQTVRLTALPPEPGEEGQGVLDSDGRG